MSRRIVEKISLVFLALSPLLTTYSQISVPYSNFFESSLDSAGWQHYATTGVDDWACGIPSGIYFNSAFSGVSAWKTKLNGSFSSSSTRYLETPDFDLTNTSVDYAFIFMNKRHSNLSTTKYSIEYSTDSGASWNILFNSGAQSKNWQPATGFSTNMTSWSEAVTSLSWLQGQVVRFRFKCYSGSGATGDGFMIDDFKIQEAYYNIAATTSDTIKNLNKYFSSFQVIYDFNFSNQYSTSYPFSIEFYFSSDPILDITDPLIGTQSFNASATLTDISKTLPLPPDLNAGYYYIFYNLDATNSVAESNELDNINYTVLKIDTIYAGGHSSSFENGLDEFVTVPLPLPQQNWTLGDPNAWHIEDARYGENAWLVPTTLSSSQYLETPYVDLSATTNTTICFWYRNSRSSSVTGPLNVYLKTPAFDQPTITYPLFSGSGTVSTQLPPPRHYYWDCYCKNIPGADGELSTKFRLTGYGEGSPVDLDKTGIDDIYIGSAKPDAAIQCFTEDRFTSTIFTQDTIRYLFFNAGLSDMIGTTTSFYWSTDSLFDSGDLFLGSNTEPWMDDTTFVWRNFAYTKPSNAAGTYYLFYLLDADSLIDEMREYDNLGYFIIHQEATENLPYFNDFESVSPGWRHRASLGTDEWVLSTPQKTHMNQAFSGTSAFMTNDTGIVSPKSRMHLFTPIFNLTELYHPVMEFDLLAHFYGVDGYNAWSSNMGNIMYSTDGGATWTVLDTSGTSSFKRLYYRMNYDSISGADEIDDASKSVLLYGKDLPMFRTQIDYQARNYDDNTHYVIDLAYLGNKEQIQFMFVYANHNAPMEGVMLDNFEITEKRTDLKIADTKGLLASASDSRIKLFFKVSNDENYISDSTSVELYCSIDSTLDASDVLIHTEPIPEIMPYYKDVVVIDRPAPANYGIYNYLIYHIDPDNLNTESDELNNTGYFALNMDSSANYAYPVQFDFDDEYIDGWTWYHDSTGSFHHHTFRHQTLIKEPSISAQDGQWFLDPIDINDYSSSVSQYPRYFLESPSFDFANLAEIHMSFDFLCIGKAGVSSEGGNMEYSTDGGMTWQLLSFSQDPYAVNWYNLSSVNSLSNQPGWNTNNWSTASYNLSFLAGESHVRFRFKFRAQAHSNVLSPIGFRLDNFQIEATTCDLKTSVWLTDINADIHLPSFYIEYEIENSGTALVNVSNTKFYWSENATLDSGDILLYDVPEIAILPLNTLYIPRNIYYPTPLNQETYYLFYEIDAYDNNPEQNESNNLGLYRINYNNTGIADQNAGGILVQFSDQALRFINLNDFVLQTNFSIVNTLGAYVDTGSLELDPGGSVMFYPHQTLATGIYFCHLQVESTPVIIKFMVI